MAPQNRKARTVGIATLSALALFFQGCGEDEEAYCVDEFDTVVENENCYAYEDGTSDRAYFWYFGSGISKKKVKKGMKILKGTKIAANDKVSLQSRGGFGSQARSSGFGRVSAGG